MKARVTGVVESTTWIAPSTERTAIGEFFKRICGTPRRAREELPDYGNRQGCGKKGLMAYVIAEPCIGTKDSACVDACPVDCIHPKKDEPGFDEVEILHIEPVECIDCGACVPVCPVSAIFAIEDLPEKWNEFAARNAAYYGK